MRRIDCIGCLVKLLDRDRNNVDLLEEADKVVMEHNLIDSMVSRDIRSSMLFKKASKTKMKGVVYRLGDFEKPFILAPNWAVWTCNMQLAVFYHWNRSPAGDW